MVRSATSTVLTNATGTVLARLGNDPLILAKSFGAGRAVHFGTLDYFARGSVWIPDGGR